MKLTPTEQLAYTELQARGYKQIEKTKEHLPDFICDGKDRYEVKKTNYKQILFTQNQIKTFIDTDKILVYREGKLISEFLWKDKALCGLKIGIIHGAITLSLEDKYIEYLKKQAEEQKRDMGTIVELALDALEREAKRKVKKDGKLEGR